MSEQYGGNMAFPIHNTGHGAPFDEGMSLRDYIAIQAMQALLSNGQSESSYAIARYAFKIADVMLEHRVSGEQ
jgi:hypothetical protein